MSSNLKHTDQPWPDAPAEDVIPIDVSSIDQVLAEESRCIHVYTPGDLVIITKRGNTRTIPAGGFIAGMFYPIAAKTIVKAGTTLVGAVWI